MATQIVAPETAASVQSAAFWRVALLMAGTVSVLTLVNTFSLEKLSFLYKDQLRLSASAVASLGILLAIPTYFRPLIGAGSDLFPFFSYQLYDHYVPVSHHSAASGCFALNGWGLALTIPAGLLIFWLPRWAKSTQPLSAKPNLVEPEAAQ